MKRLAIGSGVAVVVVAAAGALLSAQEQPARSPILHQDIAPPEPGEGAATEAGRPMFGAAPTEGQNPSAFGHNDKILSEPEVDAKRSPAEPVHGRGGFAADRDTEARPDYQTGPDSTLQYVTVFNPTVVPWKRMSSMDAVMPDYRLYTSDSTSKSDLTVGGQSSSDRDMFWASLVVDLRPGVDVPIPSVAPDMRVLSYEVEPRIPLVFSKDQADNFYVRSDENRAAGAYRLVFLADADAGYFAPQVPRRYRVHQVQREAQKRGLLREVPDAIAALARDAHARLGVGPNSRLDIALDKLTYYFREYEAKSRPQPSGRGIYWDLFTSQAGVCRHRSFAFMITANALGIPTRYLTNEAHAWVEVWVPGQNWLRVDLGGAAMRMQVDNASDKSMHTPRAEDPFAKPESYENNYTQLEGDVAGLSAGQKAERQQAADGDPSAEFDPGAPEADDGSGINIGPGKSLPAIPRSAIANKVPTRLTVTEADAMGFRGETLRVSGSLVGGEDELRGIGGQRVEIWLSPRGADGEGAQLVGRTVTEPDGRYDSIVSLPEDLELQEYEVFASTSGDLRFAPALSD